jgi:hypothetical protein
MMKRNILTSVVASTVLAGVLAMSGCGGSSNSNEPKAGGLKSGEVAKAEAQVGAGSKVDLATSTGAVASTIKFNKVANASGAAPECAATSSCNTTVTQESSCPKKKVVNPILRYVSCYGKTALDYAYAHKADLKYDPTKQMVVYGGAIIVKSDDFDTADLTLDVKGLDCGLETRTEVSAGFANPGHKVFAMIRVMDGCGNISEQKWTKEVTMDENGDFTLDIVGLELGADGQVEILLFSIKDADKTGSTGVSGAAY